MNTIVKKTTVTLIAIDEERVGQRLDNFLLAYTKNIPKSVIYRIIRQGQVRVNKKRCEVSYKLQLHDHVRIPPLEITTPAKRPVIYDTMKQGLLESILFEDNNFLVLNKPAGIAVHAGSEREFGVIEALRAAKPQARFLELVHRLDRDTSGCLLIAKNRQTLLQLQNSLRHRQVHKTYCTIVHGKWSKSLTRVSLPLHKYYLNHKEHRVKVSQEGKSAQTDFSIIKQSQHYTMLHAKPVTGRTHQIRVHCASSGHAILGDDKYGDREINKQLAKQGCKRLFLHAEKIEFSLDNYEKPLHFTAALPTDMQDFM